ncbi:MAG: YlzJ-like family protein [Eubacteriales bacterium]|nr:YlzJ-like family protein [Eubacteriales bacterium]MDD3073197.1 YlzJ-like family protein [Eubacteriales bacterium]MDD4079317.1 YlzJ-like family protein [Eubacteriales bacterium]MDD4768763.1 YlzJ-like family protein [Eubacteriales bacterium]
MVLYTPYDVDIIMRDLTQPEAKQREVRLANGIVLLGQDVESGFKIERVVCGNSNAYLIPEFQPGMVIKLG